MFSFHKPKIYRSNLGCCICKAKSSSSRFTDSQKYENEFERCFRIEEKRSGEICNACVLLVKRWKKLSPEGKLTKHWHHVVDARAGPGTKLTNNRRLTSGSNNHNSSSSSSSASSSHGSVGNDSSKHQQRSSSNNKSDVLPLSSNNQANNQPGPAGKTASRFVSSKARAIDTNVSTFTFGEPHNYHHRRSYMSCEPAASYLSASSSYSKPQSALSSGAFDSVIKRFRQRQQQEQLDARRRQLNRQQRSQQQQRSREDNAMSDNASTSSASASSGNTSTSLGDSLSLQTIQQMKSVFRRPSDSSTDVSSLLDSTIWRREKICCGYIFRGPFNEVAIMPKLLKPCSCRTGSKVDDDNVESKARLDTTTKANDDTEYLLRRPIASPPPRTTKSGSISSCDSNTSGTGSMEPTIDEIKATTTTTTSSAKQGASNTTDKTQVGPTTASPAKRPRSINLRQQNKRRQQQQQQLASNIADNDSTSGASTDKNSAQSPSDESSSDVSPSRLMLMAVDDDDDDDEDEGGLILDEDEVVDDDACESSNDASSSSVESLTGIEQGKNSGTVAG